MLRQPKLLIVEDDFYLSDIYQTSFTNYGYDVSIAVDGLKASEKLKEDYDMVLMDLMLPYITGKELIGKYPQHRYLIISNMDEMEIEKVQKKYKYVIGSIGKSQYTPREICLVIDKLLTKYRYKLWKGK